jgi:HTH-type transcriptional regulator/antitoxin HigA
MEIRPLHTEEDYRAALAEMSALVHLDPESGTPEGDALEVLIIFVERYEAEHFPIENHDSIEAIRF